MKRKFSSGDIIWVDLDPVQGHEQQGLRPALIVWGNKALNYMPGLAQVCAITNTDNDFAFHFSLAGHCDDTTGFVCCEQTRVIDLNARNAKYKDKVSREFLDMIQQALIAMYEE